MALWDMSQYIHIYSVPTKDLSKQPPYLRLNKEVVRVAPNLLQRFQSSMCYIASTLCEPFLLTT